MHNVRGLFRLTCAPYGTAASVSRTLVRSITRPRVGRSGFKSDLIVAGVLDKHSRPCYCDARQG